MQRKITLAALTQIPVALSVGVDLNFSTPAASLINPQNWNFTEVVRTSQLILCLQHCLTQFRDFWVETEVECSDGQL